MYLKKFNFFNVSSRAIMTYLVSQYSIDDDSLYPKDVRTRALVDQRLQFDLGTLYARMTDYFVSEKQIKFSLYNKFS